MSKQSSESPDIVTLIAYETELRQARRQRARVPQQQFYKAMLAGLKRLIDILGAGTGLLLLLPLLLLTATLIWIEDRGPILFVQDRVGRNGKLFKFYKFRSMVINAEALKDSLVYLNESSDGVIFKSRHDPRITRVGRIIRRLSIDELPQLLHVLSGEMSLVGPRPPVPREVADYTPEDLKRLHAKPGLTCIWQVSGRSEIPFRQQVRMDQDYICHQSLRMDLILLFKTIRAVIGGRGAY